MKLSGLTVILIVLIFICGICDIFALEIGGSYRLANLSLDQVTDFNYGAFTGNNYSSWGLSFWGNHDISDNLRLDAGFFSDPVLKNIAYTVFSFSESFFNLGVGPFFGYFNSDLNHILKSGISTSIKLELPAIFFLDFRTDSSLATRLVLDGDYIQERTDFSFGFYVMNAICTLNMLSKKYTQKVLRNSLDYEMIDSLNEYSFMTHLYQKNMPYRITLKFAYQNLFRQFVQTTTDLYTLNSIIIGTKLELNIVDGVQFFVDMDHSVYSFGQDKFIGTILEGYAFRGSAGLVVNLDKFIQQTISESDVEF